MAVLERKSDSVDINGPVCETGFNIMASPEAFEILSDRIYPNKIKAVVRELSTNAVDATIDARKVSKLHTALFARGGESYDVPALMALVNDNAEYVEREVNTFENNPMYNLSNWTEQVPLVHLPNRIEPWFSIRDYGTGLSHEFIMKLYVSYFWSDKKTSNDYTGCLGLGSKSPFAYTDHFTVTSYFNGEKRMYNAHLSNGFPSISIFTDEATGEPLVFPTDEPNGIEVQFGVKAGDFDEFANEARRLYPYFKMQPKVVGNSLVTSFLESVRQNKENGTYYSVHNSQTVEWGFRKSGDVTGPLAIMGNIAYPISLQNSYNYDSLTQQILRSNIEIVFPVGALQITPSREQLSYKPSTIQAIEVAIKQIATELADKFNEKIQSADTLWEARCLASDHFHNGEFKGFVSLLSLNKLKWQGQDLGATLHINFDKEKDGDISIYKFDPSNGRKMKSEVRSIPLDRDIKIFELDLPRGSFTRLEIEAGSKGKSVYAVSFTNRKAFDKFIEKLGMKAGTTFLGTSTLPKPTIGKRASYTNDAKIFKYVDGESWRFSRQYKRWAKVGADFDLADGGIYVEMFRYRILDKDGHSVTPDRLNDLIKLLRSVGEDVENIIGVRKTMVKQFKRSDDWVEVHEYCKNVITNQMVTNKLGVKIADIKELNTLIHKDMWVALAGHITELNDGPLKDFVKKVSEVNTSAESIPHSKDKYESLAGICGVSLKDDPTHANLQDEAGSLMNRYPMLRFVAHSYEGVDKDVIAYINGIDN